MLSAKFANLGIYEALKGCFQNGHTCPFCRHHGARWCGASRPSFLGANAGRRSPAIRYSTPGCRVAQRRNCGSGRSPGEIDGPRSLGSSPGSTPRRGVSSLVAEAFKETTAAKRAGRIVRVSAFLKKMVGWAKVSHHPNMLVDTRCTHDRFQPMQRFADNDACKHVRW
jgi:hypothetical protein